VRRQLRALSEQLPPSGSARAFAIFAILVGTLVALSVPVFFGILLAGILGR
jgi:hypothetical protein